MVHRITGFADPQEPSSSAPGPAQDHHQEPHHDEQHRANVKASI